MMIRTDPVKPPKPRNPVAVAAKQRAAGPHQKTASAERQTHKRLLDKLLAKTGKE